MAFYDKIIHHLKRKEWQEVEPGIYFHPDSPLKLKIKNSTYGASVYIYLIEKTTGKISPPLFCYTPDFTMFQELIHSLTHFM